MRDTQCVSNSSSRISWLNEYIVQMHTHAHTHTSAVAAAAATESLEWTYRISSQESVLADVSSSLAKEMSDSQAELRGFSCSLHYILTIVLRQIPEGNEGNTAGELSSLLSSSFL